jgi:hypothetical protein
VDHALGSETCSGNSVCRRRGVAAAALVAAGIAILILPSVARAVDPFEIQVYDATVAPPRTVGAELHVNSVVSGSRASVPPELPAHHQSHFTLEPSVGLTDWWEVGAYLQTALLPDGSFEYAGSKLRTKFVAPARAASAFHFGVNLEVSRLPEHYDRDKWGAEIRPIVTWSSARGAAYVSINPILDISLAGMGASDPPSFEPAATVCYVVEGLMSVGLEYYANFGPIGRWSPVGEQEHYLFEVVNVLRWKRIEINAGVGEGLTDVSNPFVAKAILGFR